MWLKKKVCRCFPARTFKEIVVKDEKIVGVRCMEVIFRGFKRGRPDITEIPGTEHILPADIVVWAIGQGPDFSFLPQDGSINTRFPVGVQSDEAMKTTLKGVFVAGDVHRGVTFFVVDAIGEGHMSARSIDRYLRGEKGLKEPRKFPVVTLSPEDIEAKFSTGRSCPKWARSHQVYPPRRTDPQLPRGGPGSDRRRSHSGERSAACAAASAPNAWNAWQPASGVPSTMKWQMSGSI